jgi:hypothetical protein
MQKMVSRSIYNLKIDAIYMYDIPFDRSFLQLSNGIRHVMPSTDTKPELTTKASMAQPLSQPAVCANGLKKTICFFYKVFIVLTVYKNKQKYVQLFLTPIENCTLRSYPELIIRIVKITMVGAVKIKHKEKNTAADGCGAMFKVKCVLFVYGCIFLYYWRRSVRV